MREAPIRAFDPFDTDDETSSDQETKESYRGPATGRYG